MKTVRKIAVLGLAVMMIAAAGCNTFKGVGEDIEAGGKKIQSVGK
jgi:predicted small secreted protein